MALMAAYLTCIFSRQPPPHNRCFFVGLVRSRRFRSATVTIIPIICLAPSARSGVTAFRWPDRICDCRKCLFYLVGVAGFESATPSSQGAVAARTRGELLRGFFGTLCADFGTLCPFRSHIRDSAAKRQSEERTYYRDLLARPKRFELLTPRFVVWCSIQLSYGRGAS
jgi:hypothetical protein